MEATLMDRVEFTMSAADQAASDAAYAALMEHERVEAERCKAVLAQVKMLVSEEVFSEIMSEIDESGYAYDFQIADAPKGHADDQGAAWGDTYVDQTTNGGHTGDEFAGTVSIPLGNGKFFQFGYSM